MCPVYFESIRVDNGQVFHLNYHQQRVSRVSAVRLQEAIDPMSLPPQGVYKLRISYTPTEVLRIDLQPYTPKRIETLQVVQDDRIEYAVKREDRAALNRLHEQREDCDEVLIIKNGRVTDTSFCNILLSDGGSWVTPSTPLLEGTCRARLLQEGRISVTDVRLTDLPRYRYFMLINAMLDFDENRRKPISHICLR